MRQLSPARPISCARPTCRWMSMSPTRQTAPLTGRGADAPTAFIVSESSHLSVYFPLPNPAWLGFAFSLDFGWRQLLFFVCIVENSAACVGLTVPRQRFWFIIVVQSPCFWLLDMLSCFLAILLPVLLFLFILIYRHSNCWLCFFV
jgi:hypothetical protein